MRFHYAHTVLVVRGLSGFYCIVIANCGISKVDCNLLNIKIKIHVSFALQTNLRFRNFAVAIFHTFL